MRTLEELTRPNIWRLMNIMELPHLFFLMRMKIRITCRTTAIRIRCNGS